MTTPTTAEVGHGSKEPTVVEIDGFRGRLISADDEVRHRATAKTTDLDEREGENDRFNSWKTRTLARGGSQ